MISVIGCSRHCTEINAVRALSGRKQPDNFDEIFIGKSIFRIEKWQSGHYQQLSFKTFINSFSIPKLLSKVS